MKKCFGFWGILLLLVPASLSAHPHVFIEGVLTPKVSGNHLLGSRVRWSFDQIYSAQIIMDFDVDQSSRFEAAELQNLYDNAFVHLNEFNYFLEVRQDAESAVSSHGKNPYSIGPARDFDASIEKGKVIYEFFVPFNGEEGISLEKDQEYILFLEDKEYFIAFNSLLNKDLSLPSVEFGNKEFMVQNLTWGPYPVRAVSVKVLPK